MFLFLSFFLFSFAPTCHKIWRPRCWTNRKTAPLQQLLFFFQFITLILSQFSFSFSFCIFPLCSSPVGTRCFCEPRELTPGSLIYYFFIIFINLVALGRYMIPMSGKKPQVGPTHKSNISLAWGEKEESLLFIHA